MARRYNRRNNRGGTDLWGVAKKALSTAMMLKDVVNTEYKHYEENIVGTIGNGDTNQGVTSFATLLCDPTQGLTEDDRIGDSIKLQNLTCRGSLYLQGTNDNCTVRCIIFKGNHENAALFPMGHSISGTQTQIQIFEFNDPWNPKMDDTKYQTKFLFDKTYVLDKARNTTIPINWSFPLNWHTHFSKSGVKVEDGGVYFGCISDTPAAEGNHLNLTFDTSYTDS